MSSEGIQITIPDLDDDDYSTPSLFGNKPVNSFGSSSNPFGQDSPTSSSTPNPFGTTHARNDSVNSEDSSFSSYFSPQAPTSVAAVTSSSSKPTKSSNLAAGVSSLASPPPPPQATRKTSLASLRSAFSKAAKSTPVEQPPLPPLRNPFSTNNRSTTSLAPSSYTTSSSSTHSSNRRPSTSTGAPRPVTPTRTAKTSFTSSTSKRPGTHAHHLSTSADPGHEFGTPPVPPVPALHRRGDSGIAPNDTSGGASEVVLDPRTPSDYALHAVFMRFATAAEVKIDHFLRQPLDRDPLLTEYLSPSLDPAFDDLLLALGKVARRHAKPVVDSLMRWRKASSDGISTSLLRLHVPNSHGVAGAPLRAGHHSNRSVASATTNATAVGEALAQRKSLASIYVMCRALLAVVQSLASASSLPDSTARALEEITFEPFRRADVKLLFQNANYRATTALFARLLGELAERRFVEVTDRFVSELQPVAAGQVLKDSDMRYVTLLHGLEHVRIKTYPPEKFDEGAEFIESLARAFDNAHGLELKTAFAETLVHLLHPIGKTAEAEVNHPLWEKAIGMIYPKAKDMMSKPRYWPVAYPLVVTSLCVGPRDYFLKHWISCFDAGIPKLKEKSFRLPVMNGMMRLIWTYVYRCHESHSAATSKLDGLLRHFFPSKGQGLFPPDEYLEPFVYIIHFVLARHPEFGSDWALELAQENAVQSLNITTANSNLSTVIGADRLAVSVQAVLLTLHALERDDSPVPAWPSSSDFSSLPPSEDYPSAAGFPPPDGQKILPVGIENLLARLSPVLSKIALVCRTSVGRMTIFDDAWTLNQHAGGVGGVGGTTGGIAYEDSSNYIIRRHPEGSVLYPAYLAPQMSMLQTCYRAWPRLLPVAAEGSGMPTTTAPGPAMALTDALDMLVCGIVHVEPSVADVASLALRRFMAGGSSSDGGIGPHASAVLARYAMFLFETVHKTRDSPGVRFVLESVRLENVWVSLLDSWIHGLLQVPAERLLEDKEKRRDIVARVDEAECGALFLLSHSTWSVHAVGVKVIRLLHVLLQHLRMAYGSPNGPDKPARIIDLLLAGGGSTGDRDDIQRPYLYGFDEFLDRIDLDRLDQWRRLPHADVLVRMADSSRGQDRSLWKFVYPAFLKACAEYPLRPLARLRDTLIAAAARHHPFMNGVSATRGRSAVAGSGGRGSAGNDAGRTISSEAMAVINQWAVWMKIICGIAGAFEHSRQGSVTSATTAAAQHARAPSDLGAEREKMLTPRGLYRYLVQFLESDHAVFRNVAATCISHLPPQGYSQLLEELGSFTARQFYDDARAAKGGSGGFIGRAFRYADLYTAVARIYYLTTHYLQDARLPGLPAVLSHVLKFVRQTQIFLSHQEVRDQFQLQRLRRYFCGTINRLFSALGTLKDSDRFIPPGMHLSLYRLCEEWCQFGAQSAVVKQRLIYMQTSAAMTGENAQAKADSIERFQTQTKKLSKVAVGSLAVLCHKAYFPPNINSGSPVEQPRDYLQPLDPLSTLDRLTSILASYDEGIRSSGNQALRLLFSRSEMDIALADEAIRRAFVASDDADTSNGRFFKIVADVIYNPDANAFSPSQAICLGLANLCHPLAEIRGYAFRALHAIHHKLGGTTSLSQYEAGINSTSPATYLRTYLLVSDVLASAHTEQAPAILTQIAVWLPRLSDGAHSRLPLLLLQSLEYWVSDIELMTENRTAFSQEGGISLCHLMTLTMRFIDTHAEQVLTLWIRLVDTPHQSNGHAAIRFLLEQSQKVGNSTFAGCACKIVACLCTTSIGRQLYEELCSIIDPARILPNVEHKLKFPNAEDADIWSNLDALFPDEPRLALGTGQFALLFLSDVALERSWEMQSRLPVLLHALVTHLDHRQPFVRERVRYMLLQLIRSWLPAYDELEIPTEASFKDAVADLENDMKTQLWEDEEASSVAVPKIASFCCKIVNLLTPLAPRLASQWGSVALMWATGCAVRSIAFRSLQVFRGIMPEVSKDDLGILIGRLSSTVSGTDVQLQGYTVEVLLTLTVLASSPKLSPALVPQLFWCACACLSTTAEREFKEVLSLLGAILARIDLDDPETSDTIFSLRPPDWKGASVLQPSLLAGLRSNSTSSSTFDILQRLSSFEDDLLIDEVENRVRTLYAVILPWCLQDMSSDQHDPKLAAFAERIAQLADREEDRSNVGRIMTSFAKSRFRTRDDFLRQSVMTLRDQFGTAHWTDLVVILMGLILNKETWLRVQTLQILKALFQPKPGTRNPVELFGSELLMPLLRLVESEVASQALDVLEEPLTVSGGLAAKQVLRMSMHLPPRQEDADTEPVIFGIPEESGWCIAQPDEMRATCRANVEAVFDTCKMIIRPSRIDFHPEFDAPDLDMASFDGGSNEAIGDLVQDLHALSSFFQDSPQRQPIIPVQERVPNHQSMAKWATILAKSTTDAPQTPLIDVFRVDTNTDYSDLSDDDSGSDAESDHFIFDSPAYLLNS